MNERTAKEQAQNERMKKNISTSFLVDDDSS